jgi:DNA polymerase I-like protein with 3'-5' exonuclease and polymerase domains
MNRWSPEYALGRCPSHIRWPDPKKYLSDNYVVLDFETTTLDYGSAHNPDNQVLCVKWICGPDHPSRNTDMQGVIGGTYDLEPLLADIHSAEFIVAHHSKFELGWLDRCGIDLAKVLPFCTRIAELCIAGNRKWALSLADCLERRGIKGKDPIGKLIRQGMDTRDIPMKWLYHYCGVDVLRTEELFLDQREHLERDGLLAAAYTRNILTPVLWDIEKRGLHLDPDRVAAVVAHYENEEARLLAEWEALTDGVNPRSAPQKRELLYTTLGIKVPKDAMGKPMTTPAGEFSTSEAALRAIKATTVKQRKVVATLLEYTAVSQALSKTVRKLRDCVEAGDRLYADFIQFSAGTHRLASRGRNYALQLQNFARAFRPAVAPRNAGWYIGDGDSSGIEFRTAVDLAKDDQGRQDIEDKIDVHANTARITLADRWDPSLGEKEGSNKAARQDAKADTFKPLYGGSSGTELQREYFAWFRERYSGIAAMQAGWAETVLRTKQLRLASGLLFYWPNARLNPRGKIAWPESTQIYDYPIQSLATAEMCPTATVYLWHMMRVTEMQSFLINLVHDSAVGEIHPDEREQWAEYMQWCFNEYIVRYLKQVYCYEWTTPLESEVNILPHWDDHAPEEWMAQWEEKPKEVA